MPGKSKNQNNPPPTDGFENKRALAILAHDIKTPLTTIVSMLEVIKKGYVTDMDKIKDLIARSINQVETLITMVNDMLDYTLLEDKTALKLQAIPLFEVIRDSLNAMKSYAEQRNITLTYHQDISGEKYVNGNYTFLFRAFNNIMMNAIKYNKEKGSITIDCCKDTDDKNLTIIFADTGIGIPEDDLDKVFKIFERGKQARRNLDGSLGLGLALVKQIIEFHDGSINVTSKFGEGTTVTVTLPLLNQKTGKQGGTNEA